MSEVDQRISAAVGAFRTAQTSDDRMPEGQYSRILDAIAVMGANPNFARRAHVSGGTGFLVPADGWLCYVADAQAACGALERLEEQGIIFGLRFGGDLAPGTFELDGIARDGIKGLEIRISGRASSVLVEGNAFHLTAFGTPEEIKVSGPDGEVRVPVHVPVGVPEAIEEMPPNGALSRR